MWVCFISLFLIILKSTQAEQRIVHILSILICSLICSYLTLFFFEYNFREDICRYYLPSTWHLDGLHLSCAALPGVWYDCWNPMACESLPAGWYSILRRLSRSHCPELLYDGRHPPGSGDQWAVASGVRISWQGSSCRKMRGAIRFGCQPVRSCPV